MGVGAQVIDRRRLFWLRFLWIAVLTLISLALSAWVKWRIVATGIIFGTSSCFRQDSAKRSTASCEPAGDMCSIFHICWE